MSDNSHEMCDVCGESDGACQCPEDTIGHKPSRSPCPNCDGEPDAEASRPTLRKATGTLYDLFGCGDGIHPYIALIGEGADTIHVMLVRKPKRHEKQIPAQWEGWPVKATVTGRMRPC